MFRLLAAGLLAGSLLVCGSAVRGAALVDWSAALSTTPCRACGAARIHDPATGRTAPCGPCRGGRVAAARRGSSVPAEPAGPASAPGRHFED